MSPKVPHHRMIALRNGFNAVRRRIAFLAIALAGVAAVTHADNPAGLDPRTTIGAYMNGILPTTTNDSMPLTLSQAGVFTSTAARTPHPGFVPYELNSPLWTDGAEKSRFIAIPFDSSDPNNPLVSPRIGFFPSGKWIFPNGTVIIKNFDMKIDEHPGAMNAVRRLETRILIRNADGTIRGASYRWRLPSGSTYTEADVVPERQDEMLTILQADNTTRQQNYTYPGPSDCVRCHNTNAGMLLGIRTSQLNGNLTYQSTGRTDNQLHTWDLIGMLDTPLADSSTYARSVDIGDTSAPLERRVRSYLASNCAHCHQPGGEGPFFDMRFETSSPDTHVFDASSGNPFGIGLIRGNLNDSRLFIRDAALPNNFPTPMPPIARNVPDQRVLNTYNEWVNYTYDVISATRLGPTQVRLLFNRPLEAISAATAANYVLNNSASVTQAVADADPAAVILTTSILTAGTTFTVMINDVREAQGVQNAIWPNTSVAFTTPPPTVPGAPSITVFQAGNGQATFSFAPPANDGGAPVNSYQVTCTPGPFVASGTSGPLSVTGLSNGTTYSCSAKAGNSVGLGPASPAVDVTPAAAVPDAPSVLTATPGNGSATFSFSAPNDNGAPITAYTAECNPGGVTGGGTVSPFTVSGLSNGTAYSCAVAAINSVGTGPYSAPVSVTPDVLKLTAVVSRKTHGTAGTFDLPIDYRMPIGGAVSVEPRVGDAGHLIVFQFNRAITSIGGVTATAGTAMAQAAGNEVIVTLMGVNDGDRVTISLTDVNGPGLDASASMGFLVGDVNNSRSVNAIDATAVKVRTGQLADAANYFYDLNASGGITASEVSAVKARSGKTLS